MSASLNESELNLKLKILLPKIHLPDYASDETIECSSCRHNVIPNRRYLLGTTLQVSVRVWKFNNI
jgi:hypothetical protein